MTNWKRALGLSLALASGASISSALAQQLNSDQIQIIRETAASICNTIKDAKGQKSNYQIQGDVNAQLSGLVGKLVDIGGAGKGSLSREEFEGLSRDATATALEGDRGCRERLFDKMFDKLTTPPTPNKSGMSKADKLIAALDLGYDLESVFQKVCLSCLHTLLRLQEQCKGSVLDVAWKEVSKVNGDASWLHLKPYNFAEYKIITSPRLMRMAHTVVAWNFTQQITEQDALEAYELGRDISMLQQQMLNRFDQASQAQATRQDLTLHLRSLNLSEVDNQIPMSADLDFLWVDKVMASLRGLIRKNYPTISVSE